MFSSFHVYGFFDKTMLYPLNIFITVNTVIILGFFP